MHAETHVGGPGSIPHPKDVDSSRSYASKAVQRICAGPSLLLWTLLASFSLFWIVKATIQFALGDLVTGGWRLPYLVVVCSATLVCSIGVFRSIRLAIFGLSRLPWHAYSFGLGMIALLMMGIVGD